MVEEQNTFDYVFFAHVRGDVDFIRDDQKGNFVELSILQKHMELSFGNWQASRLFLQNSPWFLKSRHSSSADYIARVDHKNNGVCTSRVPVPLRSVLDLASNVPDFHRHWFPWK